jgi:hypothetical protein
VTSDRDDFSTASLEHRGPLDFPSAQRRGFGPLVERVALIALTGLAIEKADGASRVAPRHRGEDKQQRE